MIAEDNAIKEAKALNIPVVAIADTNADPTIVEYAVPGNDDAIKSVAALLDLFKQAIAQGITEQKTIVQTPEKTVKKEEKK